MVYRGNPEIREGDRMYALVGAGVAGRLDLGTPDGLHPLRLYVPKKGARLVPGLASTSVVNELAIATGGLFSVQQEFDQKYVIVPLEFARALTEEDSAATSLEINAKSDDQVEQLQAEVKKILGPGFQVLNRQQQQPLL